MAHTPEPTQLRTGQGEDRPAGGAPPASRRDVLRLGLGAGLVLLPGGAAGAARRADDPDPLDGALERLHARVSDDDHFLSNHVPMCAEALSALGRGDAIAAWLERNLDPNEPSRGTPRPVDRARWRERLGRKEDFFDWRDFFLSEVRGEDWRVLLRRWVPRFVPGLAGAATHGVIRTAHAARALGGRESEIRRVELATALAYWASRYEELPWDGSAAAELGVEAALARVATRLPALAPPRGNIVAGLRSLRETPSFAPVAGLVSTADPARTLSEITAAFARVYLRNPGHRIAFTHAVTAPSALRLLAPHLDDETVEAATRCAWQAAAALYVVYHDPRAQEPGEARAVRREELVERAVRNGAAHAIKLTEACLREDAIAPDPIRLAAARDGAERMRG